ncbi:MAG: membrane protein insertase YidC [Rhodospirillales bacterium]
MVDNKNLILAIVLSVAILFGFEYFYGKMFPQPEIAPGEPPVPTAEEKAQKEPGVTPSPPSAERLTPGAPAAVGPSVPGRDRQAAIEAVPRVRIDTPSIAGSIALIGGRIDDVKLKNYHLTVDPGSPQIILLSPPQAPETYFAEVGWSAAGAGTDVPGPDTVWTADSETLTPEDPVTLTWTNDAGLKFARTVAVDENYMFTVTQTVENTTGEAVTLHPYALVSRHGTPQTSGFFILHEGPIGVFNNTLKEVDYDELREEGVISQSTTGGWIGFTDKFWLAAVIPDQNVPVDARFVHQRGDNIDIYQTDFTGGAVAIGAGETVESTSRIFAGAKRARLLDHYARTYNIAHFDRAIDFGWFYFLTKPLFYFLIYIQNYVGNFGIAILVLTVVIKLLFFPLANKSYKAMSQMRRLQPEMLKLRERFGDDKMRLNQEMMALYKREKVSPASGCLPMLIQIPVFFALYKVLFVTIEMRHAPFFGWINDLSAPDPTSIFNLFGLIPVDLPQFLTIGAWPLIMGVTMYLQQKLNPQPPDPMQAKIFMMLPVIFTFMLAHFPAGLVIYWTWNNVLSIIQQWVIMRRTGGAGGGITAASP